MIVTLYCPSHPELQLGPSAKPEVHFHGGFATVDTDQYPDYEAWVNHPGTPHIENLGANPDAQTSETDPDAKTCGKCGLSFKEPGYSSHMRAEAKKVLG